MTKITVTESQALAFVTEAIENYKNNNNSPFRLDEDMTREEAAAFQEAIYDQPAAEALLKEADLMVIAMGKELAVCSAKDLEEAGAMIISEEQLETMAKEHGYDPEAVARVIAMEAEKNQPTEH